jgi:uncharacterized membrane protein
VQPHAEQTRRLNNRERITVRTRLSEIWTTISSGLWFLPTVMVLGSVLLAIGTLWLDDRYSVEWGTGLGLMYSSSIDGGRSLLSTIAGSMMTVTGVVFSVTIVTLSLTSSQYGPRLLRNFLKDRGNQFVLGTFLSTFTYCLVVLRTLQDSGIDSTGPEISITVGALLALASLGVLIYFIHHISQAIQASSIFSGVGQELAASVDRLFPERIGNPPDQSIRTSAAEISDSEMQILAPRAGYVRAINPKSVIDAAIRFDAIIEFEVRPGSYVYENGLVARAWAAKHVEASLTESVCKAFVLGNNRTPFQDIDFLISQLVQSAMLALSTGVNNSIVAIEAIDWIGASLARIAERDLPDSNRYDDDGNLRVISSHATFQSLLTTAFNSLRESAASNTLATLHLLGTLEKLTGHCHRKADFETLLLQASLLSDSGKANATNDYDRDRIAEAFARVVKKVSETTSG